MNTINKIIKNIISNPRWIIYYVNKTPFSKLFSDEWYIKSMYKLFLHKKMGLDYPQTFNEKLQWLKLYDRKEKYRQMVDKHLVKKYVTEMIGEEFVIPTIGIWKNFDEIDFDSLPEKFVLKCTHDSGSIYICKDKSKLDKKRLKLFFNSRLKKNYYNLWREWPYRDIQPMIIAEPFLKDGENEFLPVYKIMCFEGQPRIIQTIQNDKQPNESIDYFDIEWNLLNMKQNFPNSRIPFKKPDCLNDMLKLAQKLAEGMHFLRVDLYVINGSIKFSEFTFYSDAGLSEFEPYEWDLKLGEMIELHEIK